MPWFRMYFEARTDAKLRSLADDEFRVWFKLLCLAAEGEDDRGTVDMSDPFIVAIEVAGGNEELLSRTCHALSRLKVVCQRDVTLSFIKFDDRQYDKPSDRPEQTRERKRRSRAKGQQPPKESAKSRAVTPVHALERDRDKEQPTVVSADAPANPIKALPRNGPAQSIVAAWYGCAGGAPVNYAKAVGLGQKLAELGCTEGEVAELYDWMGEQEFFQGRFDMGTAVTQFEKFRQSKKPRRRTGAGSGIPA
jgi:hypothetical protein